MTDRIGSKDRTRVMTAVRSSGTRLERDFAKELVGRGVRLRSKNVRALPGTPDLVFYKAKIAVFLDSCFWHGCPAHFRRPRSNQRYWRNKLDRNRTRDRFVTAELRRNGWRVFRIWEHSLTSGRTRAWWLSRIENEVKQSVKSQRIP
jgi:DNA mismatch endonuclease (patch repair protein)